MEPTGERTFLIRTREPTPLQPAYLVSVAIVSAKAAADATANDWNGGRAAIGTGPYRWIRWTPSQDVVLERNTAYWGAPEPWDRVIFRFITNDSARVAALLAGDVDVADTLPAELYDRVRGADKVKLVTTDSVFTNYLYLDSMSASITNATALDGQKLDRNPLADLRVRQAMDHALNRTALSERAMQGGSAVAGQVAAPGLPGHVAALKPAAYDPALSKRLLAEAGYPQGFNLVLTCTSDRFSGDSRTCQAVGQMLTAVGIKVQVEALPTIIYFRRWANMLPSGSSEFSATISMFGSTSGLANEGMNTIIRTPNPRARAGGQQPALLLGSQAGPDAGHHRQHLRRCGARGADRGRSALRHGAAGGAAVVLRQGQLGRAPRPVAAAAGRPVYDGDDGAEGVTTMRQMKLTAFCHPPGHWRMPGALPTDMGFEDNIRLAQTAERGKFDMLFYQDSAAVAPAFYLSGGKAEALAEAARCVRLEPLTMLAALATVTTHLGLIATATTTYNDPFSIARKFATIDHISKGRAGWNLVTSQNVDEAGNFSQTKHMDHALRYERAQEFYDVVTGLWDSWEDDAIIRDRATGRYIDPAKLHVLKHKGKHFSVHGPLNVARPPQGYPIVAQAGSSEPGRELAARTADVVFTAQVLLDEAQAFYADLKGRAAKYGRDPDHIKVMPGIRFVLGETEAAARADYEAMLAEASDQGALASVQRLAGDLDLKQFPLDGPLPDLPPSNAAKARQAMLIDLARRENLTIRQLARRFNFSLGHMVFVGTPVGLADFMQSWFEQGAADGFTMLSPYFPGPLEMFVDHVVPELQRRGIFRQAYEGKTLRENLGIPFRTNRHAGAGLKVHA